MLVYMSLFTLIGLKINCLHSQEKGIVSLEPYILSSVAGWIIYGPLMMFDKLTTRLYESHRVVHQTSKTEFSFSITKPRIKFILFHICFQLKLSVAFYRQKRALR